MARIEFLENAKEARNLSIETGASIRPDEYPAIVVLIFNPDDGIDGRPEVLILTWAQLVYLLLQKKRYRNTRAMLKYKLNKSE